MPSGFDTDVFVVGGGPAGLAAALAARQKGLRVMLADGARPLIEKACGEGIMPDGLSALRQLGVSIVSAGPTPFRGIRFVDGSVTAEAAFPAGHGFGLRRPALHQTMVAAAEMAGVELLWGASVTGISHDCVHLGDSSTYSRPIKTRWIVGADGLRSRVRAWAGLDAAASCRRRFGFRRHFHIAPQPEFMEIHWGSNAQIYITPVAASKVCVVVISRDPHLRLEQALAEFPQVAARLGDPSGPAERGAVTIARRFPRVSRGNIVLVGDASGSVDAITGEGLCLAFRQSLDLAEALQCGDLSLYETAHRCLMRRPALMGRIMLLLDGRPRLRHRVVTGFRARPALFEKMLAAHVGALSSAGLAANGLMLGWEILGRS